MGVKEDIKKALEAQKIIIGANSVLASAKEGVLLKVICSENAPALRKDILKHYSEISKFEFVIFNGNSIELGRLCGKPFGISVLGIKK